MNSTARLALVLLVALAAGCDSPRSELDPHELTTAAKSLASLSAEAELLVRQLGAADVTLNFALVHQDALQQESLKVARQLAKAPPEALRSAQQRELVLNARLQAGLGQIAKTAAQPSRGATLAQEFHRIKTEAQALEQPP